MDKEILRHMSYMEKELKRIAGRKFPVDSNRLEALRSLACYHRDQVRNFQHERHIHLLVCIVFGLVMLGAWAILLLWLIVMQGSFDTVAWLLVAMALILTVLEAAYLVYYYRLENRTQLLYGQALAIYQAIQAMLK